MKTTYDPAQRKAEYQRNRAVILQKSKTDRVQCPLCKLEYRRLYMPQHIQTRHKIQDVSKVWTCPPKNVLLTTNESDRGQTDGLEESSRTTLG